MTSSADSGKGLWKRRDSGVRQNGKFGGLQKAYMEKQPFWLPPKWQVRLKGLWVYGKTSILASAEMASSAEGIRVYGKTAILASAKMASSAEGIMVRLKGLGYMEKQPFWLPPKWQVRLKPLWVYGKPAILASAEMASSAEGIRVYGKTAILESAEMACSAEARNGICGVRQTSHFGRLLYACSNGTTWCLIINMLVPRVPLDSYQQICL
ncbi:hypothetical protein DFH28DRAFT_928175 [Melampsora americana]|nr:hypothetical protein DFH28DRAFT_928175 [Melampsora americana]